MRTLPEPGHDFGPFRIIRELRKGNRSVAQFVIDLHNGEAGGDPEYLGVGKFFPGQIERGLFDFFRQTLMPVVRVHDQS